MHGFSTVLALLSPFVDAVPAYSRKVRGGSVIAYTYFYSEKECGGGFVFFFSRTPDMVGWKLRARICEDMKTDCCEYCPRQANFCASRFSCGGSDETVMVVDQYVNTSRAKGCWGPTVTSRISFSGPCEPVDDEDRRTYAQLGYQTVYSRRLIFDPKFWPCPTPKDNTFSIIAIMGIVIFLGCGVYWACYCGVCNDQYNSGPVGHQAQEDPEVNWMPTEEEYQQPGAPGAGVDFSAFNTPSIRVGSFESDEFMGQPKDKDTLSHLFGSDWMPPDSPHRQPSNTEAEETTKQNSRVGGWAGVLAEQDYQNTDPVAKPPKKPMIRQSQEFKKTAAYNRAPHRRPLDTGQNAHGYYLPQGTVPSPAHQGAVPLVPTAWAAENSANKKRYAESSSSANRQARTMQRNPKKNKHTVKPGVEVESLKWKTIKASSKRKHKAKSHEKQTQGKPPTDTSLRKTTVSHLFGAAGVPQKKRVTEM